MALIVVKNSIPLCDSLEKGYSFSSEKRFVFGITSAIEEDSLLLFPSASRCRNQSHFAALQRAVKVRV